MSAEERVAAVAAARDFGRASAAKRGRSARWPYVPVIVFGAGGKRGDGYTHQLKARAFATREEAVAYAAVVIDRQRASYAARLLKPEYRAEREAAGLPRLLTDLLAEDYPAGSAVG